MRQEHFEVLLEDINGKLDLILESQAFLHRKIDDLDRRTDERFDLVDVKFAALNHKIDGVEVRLDAKIDGVAAELRAHRADTESHRAPFRRRR